MRPDPRTSPAYTGQDQHDRHDDEHDERLMQADRLYEKADTRPIRTEATAHGNS